ncbi:MAG: chromosome segregation protein SMC [Euryarchaeota archaeon]|nr:chromosome segregation protein SMC [Euryarchaeota archaeon]
MYITELEIDNFKSFGKKTRIPFFEGFTVISGPNGSGKSNVIDSILFCLALSSARGLRAEKLTDLINLNTGKNTAEVAITFSDGTKVRRKIKRTSHGYYSYNYLNDRHCKQGDIVEFLAKYGIKAEGYNVVMQGDITRIMEMGDSERRKIIDEIAGVSEFDKKTDQALGELEIVRERIEREELLLHELNIRMGELKAEREQALKYRDWQGKLDYFKGCLSAAQLHERERELFALQQLITDEGVRCEQIGDTHQTVSTDIEKLRKEVVDIDVQINEKSGSEYLQLLSSLEEVKGRIKISEQTIARLKNDKESNKVAIQRIFSDKKRAETRVTECTTLIRNLSIDRSNLGMELASRHAELDDVENKLQEESDDIAGAKDALFALMKKQEECKSRRSELLHEQNLLIEKSRMRSSEKERLDSRIAQIKVENDEKSEQCREYTSLIEKLVSEKKKIEQVISRAESSLFKNRSSLEKLKNEIRSRERDLMLLEAQQQAGGGPGGRALEAILEMDGVYGTVAQLGRVPVEYSTALDIAAGGRLKNVVVENDSVATFTIRYLKEKRLGRVTFLPLNKLKVTELKPLNESKIIDYAVNLVDCDPLFDIVFRHVFGSTVVVGTLDDARRMIGRYRMITLEGELLERSGAMTGGAQKKKVSGFGVSVGDEVNKLRHEIAGLEGEAAELQSAVERYTKEGEESRYQRSSIEEQISRYRLLQDEFGRRIDFLTEEKEGIEKYFSEMVSVIEGGSAKLSEIEDGLEGTVGKISRFGSEIDELKKKLDDTGIPELTEKIERFRRESGEIDNRLRNKDADIADTQRERQHFSRRVEELEGEREVITEKNRQIDVEISGIEDSLISSKAQILEFEAKKQTFSEELGDMQQARDLLNSEKMSLEKQIVELNLDAERIRLQMVSLNERQESLIGEINVLREEVGNSESDLTLQDIKTGIARAEREIKKIGAVNMLAIEEYERVEKRIFERSEKKDVLSCERTKLIERIEHFEKMKYDSFMESFNAIDRNFRKIFARLTSGNGRLVLNNEDDPFSGGMTFAVQPRDKKVHLLSALSGGEKSLTTLSFIFSIQQYMPAPFYALDEVDMMLDTSNVERISTMIKELSTNAQSIVVSLRKPTIEHADRIIGVTSRPDKSTYVTGVKNNA